MTRTNWAGNVVFAAREYCWPASPGELADLVASRERVRAVGAGHSFNRVADTEGTQVDLSAMPRILAVDPVSMTVRAGAGLPLYEVCARLRQDGLALPALPSTPHVTVAGACATGTHGSGDTLGPLAGYVRSVELVGAGGVPLTLSRGDTDFPGAAVSLGALGVATALTFEVVPEFEVEQTVWEGVAMPALLDEWERIAASAYSVSVFTDWDSRHSAWVKRRVQDPPADLGWTGARPADGPRHPVPGWPADGVTAQGGVPGPWDERLPHFRPGTTPSTGAETQSEYFVDRADAPAALRALSDLRAVLAPVLRVCEVRSVAADDGWLSPASGGPVAALHFTWVPEEEAVLPVLAAVEAALAPLRPRPHWGKLTALPPHLIRARYRDADRFAGLLERLDPAGVFRNALVDGVFPRTPA